MTHPLRSTRSPTGVDPSRVDGHWSAVINVHGNNLQQIEAALVANQHSLDPHPMNRGKMVSRHPAYLVAVDYRHRDAEGRPEAGKPAELDLEQIRQIYSKKYSWVSPDPPPSDGSHIRGIGRKYVAEMDQQGQPTGRVILDQGA